MFCERGQSTSDLVLHLGGFLVHECYHLSKVLHFPFRREYLDMHLTDFDVSKFVGFLACEDFGLAWVHFKSMRFRTSF